MFKKKTTKKLEIKDEVKSYPVVETISRKYKSYTFNVKIDYKNATVSIVDSFGSPANFTFHNRSLEYMAGWKEILANLSDTVDFAEKKLEAFITERNAEKKAEFEAINEKMIGFLGKMTGGSNLNSATPRL